MEWNINWILITTSIILLFTYVYYQLTRQNELEKLGIIHKKPLPWFGNQFPLVVQKKHLAFHIQDIYDTHNEAKYIGYFDFRQPVIMLRDPDLIKNVTIRHFDHFIDHRVFIDPHYDTIFGNILFQISGKKWRDTRNNLAAAFTPSKLKTMFKLMALNAENFANHMMDESKHEPVTFWSKKTFTKYTNDVITACSFGITVDSIQNPKNEFYVLGRSATHLEGNLGIKFFVTLQFPRLFKLARMKLVNWNVRQFFVGLVKAVIELRESKGITRPDVMQMMIDRQKKEAADNQSASLKFNVDGPSTSYTITDMAAQAYGFFFGGFDTASTLICLVTHMIAAHPTVQDKLRNDIDTIYEECNGEITYEAVAGIHYLDAVIHETMRMYPQVIFLDRLCTQPYELPPALPGMKPVILKPGDILHIPVYPLHRDPKYFDNPHDFQPERFIKEDKFALNSDVFMPFGIGPRMCISYRFAMLEAEVLICNLLYRFVLKPGKDMILPFQLNRKSIVMTPEGGFQLTLERRESSS